jgi:hypothetical protein
MMKLKEINFPVKETVFRCLNRVFIFRDMIFSQWFSASGSYTEEKRRHGVTLSLIQTK